MNRYFLRFAVLGLALSMVSFAPMAFAQDNGASADSSQAATPQHRVPDPQKQAARLAKRLELSGDQTSKITAILQSRQQQIDALRSDSSLAPRDRRAKMRSVVQDTDTQINALLTPAQRTQYATLKQNMKDRRQNAHGAPNATGSSGDSSDSESH